MDETPVSLASDAEEAFFSLFVFYFSTFYALLHETNWLHLVVLIYHIRFIAIIGWDFGKSAAYLASSPTMLGIDVIGKLGLEEDTWRLVLVGNRCQCSQLSPIFVVCTRTPFFCTYMQDINCSFKIYLGWDT